ncbi:2-polyprenyl-6-methoxyphenol hydroxylase-like FAD-dependent oxidoreductase [Nocardia transvalensis]|uniref:2-polyprenyl-6-methoxyphenol hydroxylase-like FAD-dependent oxidoreductase n=1 Tax=Nocardia transvalensis TaxID=37333 RepID=A0A7W9PJB4_9NOCA|nr:FAD-dependent monooxygenase [Nocardia transvalensis]MBB5917076.1 2-polyprenyl-6-methoxyphenol hydroxylase-like FAD-dependent oxidoreductase [Nocardia transvalensis]
MPETRTDIVISGAGPNGLMLACELALAGVTPVVLEHLPGPSEEPKANGIIGQAVRLLEMRGLAGDGDFTGRTGALEPLPGYLFSGMRLDLSEVPRNPLYGAGIPQPRLTRLLARRAGELGVDVRWGHALEGFETLDSGEIALTITGPDGPYTLTTRYLVGADGGTSRVRKRAGIAFPGTTADDHVTRFGHATVPAEWQLPDGGIEIPGAGRFSFGHNRIEGGMLVYAELVPGRPMIGATEYGGAPVDPETPMTFQELRDTLERVLGVPVPITPPAGPGPHALRRTVDQNTRLAERYREGNVLLVGDAAHVHSAMGGPGLNLGLQDAVNLGWKLAAEIRGRAPAGLLDTYQSERYPVAERVMMHSLSQTALMAPGPQVTALRQLFGELLDIPEVATHIANLLAGSDVRYDIGDDHPLSGRLVPDLTVDIDGRPRRIAELLRPARPILLDGTGTRTEAARAWSDRIDTHHTPNLLDVSGVTAVLIRPDGYVAWATADSTGPGLPEALDRWFGPAHTPAAVHS